MTKCPYLFPHFLFKSIFHANFQKGKYGKKYVPIIKIRVHNYGIIWGNKIYVINATEIGILYKLQKPNLQAFPIKKIHTKTLILKILSPIIKEILIYIITIANYVYNYRVSDVCVFYQ